jgi:ABC-2 type transport system permease protein|uniref:Transport permease protein n=1 Tax=candidate division WOR-3 bacterium TaxID=2052148 RepID=A0A7C3YS87_UNCW3
MKRLLFYLRAIWAENIKEWKLELAYKADFVRGLIDPLVYLLPHLFYGIAIVGGRSSPFLEKLSGSGDIISFVILGYIFIGFLNMALWAMGFSLRKEQFHGTLEAVFASPVPRWVFALGMACHSTLHQSIIVIFQLVVMYFIFSFTVKVSGILPSLLIIALMLFALYGFGMMVAALTLIFKQGWLVSEALSGIMMVITPIAYPLAVLPVFMQKAALFVPATYGVLGVRHFLIGERLPFSPLSLFLRLLLLCLIWITFGILVFNLIDRYTRRQGILQTY